MTVPNNTPPNNTKQNDQRKRGREHAAAKILELYASAVNFDKDLADELHGLWLRLRGFE